MKLSLYILLTAAHITGVLSGSWHANHQQDVQCFSYNVRVSKVPGDGESTNCTFDFAEEVLDGSTGPGSHRSVSRICPAHKFTQAQACSSLRDTNLVILGDSNMRLLHVHTSSFFNQTRLVANVRGAPLHQHNSQSFELPSCNFTETYHKSVYTWEVVNILNRLFVSSDNVTYTHNNFRRMHAKHTPSHTPSCVVIYVGSWHIRDYFVYPLIEAFARAANDTVLSAPLQQAKQMMSRDTRLHVHAAFLQNITSELHVLLRTCTQIRRRIGIEFIFLNSHSFDRQGPYNAGVMLWNSVLERLTSRYRVPLLERFDWSYDDKSGLRPECLWSKLRGKYLADAIHLNDVGDIGLDIDVQLLLNGVSSSAHLQRIQMTKRGNLE